MTLAAKSWKKQENYPSEILIMLQEYGACYLYDNEGKSEAALGFIPKDRKSEITKNYKLDNSFTITLESVRQVINGCGFGIEKCTNGCQDCIFFKYTFR